MVNVLSYGYIGFLQPKVLYTPLSVLVGLILRHVVYGERTKV